MVAKIHDARENRFGGFFEDFNVGDVYKHWPGKTITESDNHFFCLLTMAASPIHIDQNFARTELLNGKNLVVGTYIYSLLLGMSVPDISGRAIANLGLKDLKHIAPMYHGDTLYGSTEIINLRKSVSKQNQGILTVCTNGYNQEGTKVCTFTRSILLPMRLSTGKKNG